MITEIGIVAGEIWNYLDKNGQTDLEAISEGIGRPREIVLMSLGWLAREGHVELAHPEKGFEASLKEKTAS